MDCRCSQQPIDHRNGGSSRAGEMAPAIGNLVIDIQYPTCEPLEKITTQPCLETRTTLALGQLHDASSNLPQRKDTQMEELLVAQSGSLSRCHPLNKTDIVLHCDFSADRKHQSDSAV